MPMNNIDLDFDQDYIVPIKVIGVGGGGGNAVNRMVNSGMNSVAEYVSINTDPMALKYSQATYKLHIGGRRTGAGGKPEEGRLAAEEGRDDIAAAIGKDTQMIFVTAGMGGGTGTGGAPVVAQIAREMGVLTVGVVTKPFQFEGRHRMRQADEGIAELRKHVDALVVIPNERLQYISEEKITLFNAFAAADDVLRQAVQSISDLINHPGMVNVDFADVTTIVKDAGYAHMGVGQATGDRKAEKAAKAAISSPLLETSINGAKGVLVNIVASRDIGLNEVSEAAEIISAAAHPDVNYIWGFEFDDDMNDELKVTVIATNFENDELGVNLPTWHVDETASAAAPAAAEEPKEEAPAEPVAEETPSAKDILTAEEKKDDIDDEWEFFANIFKR